MIKRTLDIIMASMGLLVLSPALLLLWILLLFNRPGGVFYRQIRVGKDGQLFKLLKFRTMKPDSELQGQLSLGEADPRIIPVGRWMRRYKLDELPQLFNVLAGDMSIVGPRPEVPRYVDRYPEAYREILQVRPGLTDEASLLFFNEGALLAGSPDPEKTYLEDILPRKIELAQAYAREHTFRKDMWIIIRTALRLFAG